MIKIPRKIEASLNYLSITYFAYVVIVIINIISLIYTNSPSNKSQLLTKKVNRSNPAILGQASFSQLGILIPLYIYPAGNPNPDWQKIADTQKIQNIPVVAIVNPHSGPGVCSTTNPDSNYINNMQLLRNAGVTMVGYVATGYGNKLQNNVKNEIDQYVNCFNVKGIFFDEVNGNANFLNYYKELYNYVKSKPNFNLVIINPGQNIDEVFLKENTFDIAVIYEDYANNWPSYNPPSFISNYSSNHFAALIHSTANDVQTMKTYIDSVLNRNIGYVYITNDILPNPWDSLPPYWQNEIEYIKIINNGITPSPTPTEAPVNCSDRISTWSIASVETSYSNWIDPVTSITVNNALISFTVTGSFRDFERCHGSNIDFSVYGVPGLETVSYGYDDVASGNENTIVLKPAFAYKFDNYRSYHLVVWGVWGNGNTRSGAAKDVLIKHPASVSANKPNLAVSQLNACFKPVDSTYADLYLNIKEKNLSTSAVAPPHLSLIKVGTNVYHTEDTTSLIFPNNEAILTEGKYKDPVTFPISGMPSLSIMVNLDHTKFIDESNEGDNIAQLTGLSNCTLSPTPVPTVTVTPTPGPQTTTLAFKVSIPRMGVSEVPPDRVKVEVVSSTGSKVNTGSIALVHEGNGIYRTKGSGLSFTLGVSGTYRVYVKLTTSVGRVYNNVVLNTGSTLDCTTENTSCGDLKPSSSLLSGKALLLGDTDTFSYNWINIADFDILVSEFLGRVTTKYTDFNLDGSVDVLDLEVLGLNFNKRGDGI